MMEESAPVLNEKAITPITMMTHATIRSEVFVADMSPYPTVVIVVIVQ